MTPMEKQKQYRDLVKLRYIIAKNTNTSYVDTGKLNIVETRCLIKFIQEEKEANEKLIESMKSKKE